MTWLSPSQVNQTHLAFQLLKDHVLRCSGRASADGLCWYKWPWHEVQQLRAQPPWTHQPLALAAVSQGDRLQQHCLARSKQITLQGSTIDHWEEVHVKKWLQKICFPPFLLHFGCPRPSTALCPAASLRSSHGICQALGTEKSRSREQWPGRRRISQACPPLVLTFFLLHFVLAFYLVCKNKFVNKNLTQDYLCGHASSPRHCKLGPRRHSANWSVHWNRKMRKTVFKWNIVIFVTCLPKCNLEYYFENSANSNITQGWVRASGMWNDFGVVVVYSVLEIDIGCLTLLD